MTETGVPAGAAATVHVVVRFADRRVETDLPTAWPVSELGPELLRIMFGADNAPAAGQFTWTVGRPDEEPFPTTSTLRDLNVADGAVLQLEQITHWQPPGALPPALIPGSGPEEPVGADDFRLPRQRTLSALPRRQRAVGRMAGALQAFVALEPLPPPPAPVAPAPGTFVPPAQLTVPRRPPALERGRARWRASAYEHQLDRMIQSPQLRRCVTIAVMSPKGGVGKTTVAALLGTLFALLRRDRIVAVDTNPDFGSLGRSLAPGHDVFVDDVLEVLDSPELTVTALDANLGRSVHGLMVLPVPNEPARTAKLDETAYTRVVRRLQGMVGMVLLDCATGLQGPAARAALATSDQVLLVTDADPSTASLVAEAAGLLRQRDVPTWLVVNKMTRASRLQVSSLEACVSYARGLLVLPQHAGGAGRVAGGAFDWRDAPAAWKVAVREMAAVLAGAWQARGITG